MSIKPEPEQTTRGRDISVGVVVVAASAGAAVGRLVLLPVRLVAGSPLLRRQVDRLAETGSDATVRGRERLESAAGDFVAGEGMRIVETAAAGTAPDETARVLAEHRVVERLLEQQSTEELLRHLLASPTLERTLQSPEGQRLLAQVASSPAVREALAHQTTGFIDDVADSVRAAAARLDRTLERGARRVLRRSPPAEDSESYGGLASRAVAGVLDALAAHGIYLVVTGVVALVASLVGGLRPTWVAATLAAAGWALVVGGYFVCFWSLTGQTPGLRTVHLRVRGPDGRPPGVGRSALRLAGSVLAIVPLFAGFLPVLFDRHRRSLADYIARTTVVRADGGANETEHAVHAERMMRPARST